MSRVQVSWHGTYGYHSPGPWDQCAHHWQWSLYRSPPDAPAQACALLLCVANTVTMCPPLQMEMLRNNHHISRDTWHVTGAQCRVWPVSPSPHWPRSRPSRWCHPGSVTLWWFHLRWGHGHEVRTQEGVLPQVLHCDYISRLVLPSPCDTQKNQPCEQNIMKMWSCGLGCTEHYTKGTITAHCTLIPRPT